MRRNDNLVLLKLRACLNDEWLCETLPSVQANADGGALQCANMSTESATTHWTLASGENMKPLNAAAWVKSGEASIVRNQHWHVAVQFTADFVL